MTEAESTPRTFSEAEFRHLLTLEVLRCTRYQDFLSLCLIRASGPGIGSADLESSIRRHVAEMLRVSDVVGSIGGDVAVLLVHTPESDTSLIADRIRDRIRKALVAPQPASEGPLPHTWQGMPQPQGDAPRTGPEGGLGVWGPLAPRLIDFLDQGGATLSRAQTALRAGEGCHA